MDPSASATSSPPPETPAVCSEGCGFAEPLRGDYLDWIWCSRPGALNRVRRVGGVCPASAQALAAALEPGFNPQA